MNATNLRVAALAAMGSAFLALGLSFVFDDIARLVLRFAAVVDLTAGIVIWANANRQRRASTGD